jgi:hypothetical protein
MLNFGTVIFMFVMRNLKARRVNIAFINTVQILKIENNFFSSFNFSHQRKRSQFFTNWILCFQNMFTLLRH